MNFFSQACTLFCRVSPLFTAGFAGGFMRCLPHFLPLTPQPFWLALAPETNLKHEGLDGSSLRGFFSLPVSLGFAMASDLVAQPWFTGPSGFRKTCEFPLLSRTCPSPPSVKFQSLSDQCLRSFCLLFLRCIFLPRSSHLQRNLELPRVCSGLQVYIRSSGFFSELKTYMHRTLLLNVSEMR